MQKKNPMIFRRIVDICMTILLLCLMAYQVTGAMLHEWIGMGMTALVVLHQILNKRWYGALLKGKYNVYRISQTAVNGLLILSFILTAVCGMAMSGHAVKFLYGIIPVSSARLFHLALSHWAFILMGFHLGLHIPVMVAKWKLSNRTKTISSVLFFILAAMGFYLFLKSGIMDYLFFRVGFAFLDYETSGILVFLENICMLCFWGFLGTKWADFCTRLYRKNLEKKDRIVPVCWIIGAAVLGLVLNAVLPKIDTESFEGPQSVGEDTVKQDDYILIHGGTFLMGSPESENWRIEDETQHEVTVSSFYIDAYETTQQEYERLMGSNPSTFKGEMLPVENVSWLDAVAFANAKSEDAGLTPVYTITAEGINWDLSADGYRLPTEAEWEYACRAGTTTPFNTEKSPDATEANFYGHYPYEIEENYFDDSELEAKPGEYRQTTVAVGSFKPNAWGLYDCHGNVNEWCWDYYGPYDLDNTIDPTGAADGTRHVYRGGGWNDFAKNMRSGYRAAGEADMPSFNLGIRLVRNAGDDRSGIITVQQESSFVQTSGKILIVYFSWSGNTREIAEEIQSQTGADIFEIVLLHPYSNDYNTVLMEAQEDQHNQARPELVGHVDNMDEYDTILLGYPNWWASIPMPIASFLEAYDFSGKQIIPFCSHGGRSFGQSLTAIAKLAPNANIGQGLSVHYFGGSSLPQDISNWLEINGIR